MMDEDKIDYLYKDGKFLLPILTSINKLGKEMRYEVFVIDNVIYKVSYQHPGGKRRISTKTIENGKNIGKSNETTPDTQALMDARSDWEKKQKANGYSVLYDNASQVKKDNVNNKDKLKEISYKRLFMLANKYSDKTVKYLKEPFAVSPKLDGVRCVAENKNGEISLYTRSGNKIVFLDTIKEQLLRFQDENILFDGELYLAASKYDLEFDAISGVIRRKETKSPHDHLIEYHVFDLIDKTNLNLTYEERIDKLSSLQHLKEDCLNIQFVYYEMCNHSNYKEKHDEYVSKGYEGMILRDFNSKYELGYRSNYFLKYKEFEDEEFEIVGFTEAEGTEKGAIMFICKYNKSTFGVRMTGDIETRREMYKHGEDYIGKILTVKHQGRTKNTFRFPVGLRIRDYE